jgi:hypothetical protein
MANRHYSIEHVDWAQMSDVLVSEVECLRRRVKELEEQLKQLLEDTKNANS